MRPQVEMEGREVVAQATGWLERRHRGDSADAKPVPVSWRFG